jgi:protein-S-isoprenylcysteine O-methyltransferase Ste14
MKHIVVVRIVQALWAILIVYWIILASGNKDTKIRQRRGFRLAYIFILFGATYFLASRHRYPLFPITPVTQAIGIVLCAAGVALAIWARRILGTNWSGRVVIKHDHELIQRGPYQFVRNPIYSGLLLALLGTVFALNPTTNGLLIYGVWVLAFYVKARQEEQLLSREFGEQYAQYKQRVRAALIPSLF